MMKFARIASVALGLVALAAAPALARGSCSGVEHGTTAQSTPVPTAPTVGS